MRMMCFFLKFLFINFGKYEIKYVHVVINIHKANVASGTLRNKYVNIFGIFIFKSKLKNECHFYTVNFK